MSTTTIGTKNPCLHCGRTFAPKRKDAKYCSTRCKDTLNNARKRAERDAIVRRDGNRCYYVACRWKSPKGRLYVDEVNGKRVTLCGYHHAALYRLEGGGECHAVVGGYYYGYLHISIYDLLEREYVSNGEDCPLQTDGGIEQLIDHLSGEVDERGESVPHPLIEERREKTVYLHPQTWNPEALSAL